MCVIVINQFNRILIIYYLILHRIITLQHRVTKYIIHSINSVVVVNIIGERTNNKIYVYSRVIGLSLLLYRFIPRVVYNVTQAQVKVLKTIFHCFLRNDNHNNCCRYDIIVLSCIILAVILFASSKSNGMAAGIIILDKNVTRRAWSGKIKVIPALSCAYILSYALKTFRYILL